MAFKGAKDTGQSIAKRLFEVGIYSFAELQQISASNAYLKIKESFPDKTLPVCYYLYSLEGALLDLHWDGISEKRKKELLREVGG